MGESLVASGKVPVFGRGENPINFVSVHELAALLELVVIDPSLRGRVIEFGGPGNLTFNQLAAILQQVLARRDRVRHVPRFGLRLISALLKYANPQLARQAQPAVMMDTIDMTFDAAPSRKALPSVPATDARTALERCFAARGEAIRSGAQSHP